MILSQPNIRRMLPAFYLSLSIFFFSMAGSILPVFAYQKPEFQSQTPRIKPAKDVPARQAA